ncbi:MAG: hypothetical protein PVF67_06740, partial [Anaerolineae bacterium]
MSRRERSEDPTPGGQPAHGRARLALLWQRIRRWIAHPWLRRGLTIALTLVAIASFAALLYANW